uniref:DNA (cytosine-5-)-methyltransferase n=1 Tax=Stegastes partitus TaxID=144197 RepID=A0A3B5B4X6_9TELE
MAEKAAVNVTVKGQPYNSRKLLAWLSETLQTSFTKVEQVRTGAAYCQLMDLLFPGSVDLSSVQFQSDDIVYASAHNLGLLKDAFAKAGRSITVTLAFLQWFKVFFDKNSKGSEYPALEAKGGQSLVCAKPGLYENTDVLHRESPKGPFKLISDEEDEEMETAVSHECVQLRQIKREAVDRESQGDSLMLFLRSYCHGGVDTTRPEDVIQACSDVPYCLYLYVGVELSAGKSTSVVLIGYFDQSSGVSVVKPLHALQMSVDAAAPPELKKLGLPLSNLAVFYCDAPHPAVNREFVSCLQAFSPRLMSVCGLTGMPGRACQAGLLASFSYVVDLVRDIHHHYSTCPSTNDSLKQLFDGVESYDPSLPVSAQCSFIIHVVQAMVGCWKDLVDYFKSLTQAEDAAWITTQLMTAKVKLHFLFLSHTLEPLRALQDLHRLGTAGIAAELQLTSMLLSLYAASILQPSVAQRFLGRRDVDLLHSEKKLLATAKVNVGSRAREFLWATPVVDLSEQDRSDFLEDAQAFYRALRNRSLIWETCTVLYVSDVIFPPICTLPLQDNRLSRHMVSRLAVQMGLCDAGSPESHQLGLDYLSFSRTAKGEDHCWAKVSARRVETVAVLHEEKKVFSLCDGRIIKPSLSFNFILLHKPLVETWLLNIITRLPCIVCGELVWVQVDSFSPWPGIVVPSRGETQHPRYRMVAWYGQGVNVIDLASFAAFDQNFSANTFGVLVSYREAVSLAALRCKKQFSSHPEDEDERLKRMLDWAFGGFQPSGPDGLKPTTSLKEPKAKRKLILKAASSPDSSSPLSSSIKMREVFVSLNRLSFSSVENVDIFHPLFKGSLCLKCKNNFTETLFRYDEDGYQSYCTICCYGMEVILCGNDSCCRSFCEDCLNILVGSGTFDSLKELDPWICYLCQPHGPHGALVPRQDWSVRVQGMFANNSGMEFEPHRVYPSIPANLRRPVRVLSLFDGVATGYLVLKDLGFKVEKYVASEVCEDSIAVGTVNHDRKVIHVGDVRLITPELLEEWGPFDLLIGGSPCNDLSIVNPIRKGLYEGTGRLFFEYYRILQLLKPKEDDPRPFFWLFENVVFMNTHDKVNICRFLECNPVLVDAVKVSPAHRSRYFWGNIPGMSRPIIASQKDKLNLQDCLEIGREARMTKVRTITTNPNSLKQGKGVAQLPVLHNGKEDNLWITELEKIFGFPKHYTDVRNMNRQQRQKVLGKSWSVPVIRHLFAPLKDYFACEELPPMITSSTSSSTSSSSNSTSSTSPPSPASPDVQQSR